MDIPTDSSEVSFAGLYDEALPSEAQWKYGARAGTTSPWFTGADPSTLATAANLSGRHRKLSPEDDPGAQRDLHDGYACHAPVGSLAPNSFGLHDVAGNVFEWCGDDAQSYDSSDLGDASVEGFERTASHSRRGGGWVLGAELALSACRNVGVPTFMSQSLGVRPARALQSD